MKTAWLALLVLCAFSPRSALADRDIVYAARYYAPPGSHRTSHFHLYRINPDGTGKTQLTFGSLDDYEPQWSPDGRQIAFMRQNMLGHSEVCLIRSAGRSVKRLMDAGLAGGFDDDYSFHWSPDGKRLAIMHLVFKKTGVYSVSVMSPQTGQILRRFVGASDYCWSPDSRRLYLLGGSGTTLIDLESGAETSVRDTGASPLWLDNQTVICLSANQDKGYFLRSVDLNGREKSRISLIFPAVVPGMTGDGDLPCDRSATLLPTPQIHQWLVYAMNNHNSTVGADWLFLALNQTTGQMRYLTEGQFLAWSPDGMRFCTAPGRDTTPYEKRKYPFAVRQGASAEERDEDEFRTVWFAPLYVRATAGGPMRQLTPRLSWVTAADWRAIKP